jgi:heptosyltransferase I
MDRKNADIVLVRMDKIGDLVLTLPVDEHPALQGSHVHWFISSGLGFVTAQASPLRASTEFKRRFSPIEFMRMVTWFRENRPRTVVLLHNPWWVACAAWFAGVPERMGRLSQWHSFLFLNLPIHQKRSASDRHESDFNFDLIEWGFTRLGVRRTENLTKTKNTYLRMTPPHPNLTLSARGLKDGGYRVVHPGMAGSALNWPAEYFGQLIEKLAVELPVVITGTKMDRKYLESLKPLRENSRVIWLVEELKITELLDVLSRAKSVIAPSTGVLHLAASLGTSVIGIYSPRKVEHPRRWGPHGPRVQVLLPTTQELESYPPEIMREITVDQVYQSVKELEGDHGYSSPQP